MQRLLYRQTAAMYLMGYGPAYCALKLNSREGGRYGPWSLGLHMDAINGDMVTTCYSGS